MSYAVVRRERSVVVIDPSGNTVHKGDVVRVQVAFLEMQQHRAKIQDPLTREKYKATEAELAEASANSGGDEEMLLGTFPCHLSSPLLG